MDYVEYLYEITPSREYGKVEETPHKTRISKYRPPMEAYHYAHMDMAIRYALMSHAQKDIVGAVAARGAHPLLGSYNGTLPGQDNSCEYPDGSTRPGVLHAEQNLVGTASRENICTNKGSLYITRRPCESCLDMVAVAGFKEIFYLFGNEEGNNDHLLRALKYGIKIYRMVPLSYLKLYEEFLEERKLRKDKLELSVKKWKEDLASGDLF